MDRMSGAGMNEQMMNGQMIIVNSDVTNETEIKEILRENAFLMDYDVVLFGTNVPEGEASLVDLLLSCDMDIFGYVIRTKCFEYVGYFNEELEALRDYEMICRVSRDAYAYGSMGVYCIPCGKESDKENKSDGEDGKYDNLQNRGENVVKTIAYMLVRYMSDLQKNDCLELVLNAMTRYAGTLGLEAEFNQRLSLLLENRKEYESIAKNTAPFYVITGDDTCHGVLKQFALDLAVSLIKCGQAVSTSDGRYGRELSLEDLVNYPVKGIIGFQATVLFKDYFKQINTPKYNFWFDNPMFFDDMFKDLDDNYYFLCQDGEYAKYITRYFGVKNSLHFPPAGVDIGMAVNQDRPYDIVFIGACNRVDESKLQDPFHRMYYEYMLDHPHLTFEQGLLALLQEKNIKLSQEDFLKLLWSLQNVCRNVVCYYRTRVVEVLLRAGIKVDVFGKTWDFYEGDCKDNLIRHDAVTVEQSLEIWGRAKIGLNVMTWHKDGMTERIANICLSGAVCLTDGTDYLKTHFSDNKDMVMFDLERLEELPQKVCSLLASEEFRRGIAQKAYAKASTEHIWDERAKEILRLQKV
ncbi:MAG: glycosyltransferase [Lachnospiraceae bacterium]